MYLARTELQDNSCYLLRSTIDDYARLLKPPLLSPAEERSTNLASTFFASAYNYTPVQMIHTDRAELFKKYSLQLQQLREGLPERFHSKLDDIVPQLLDLFAKDWPLVPNHTDLFENNIHVNPTTGKIVGICDWGDAEISPFGMSLAWLETVLEISITSGDFRRYHPNHQELRDPFWTRFYYYMGSASDEQKRRIKVAREVGLFLANDFQYNKSATEESEDLRILGAVILK